MAKNQTKIIVDDERCARAGKQIIIEIHHICSWCRTSFETYDEYDAHLADGKTFDESGKRRRICPR